MSVRTTMLSLCGSKISYVFKFKISITLLIFPKCRGEVNTFPTAKLTKIFENDCVTKKKIQTTILLTLPDTSLPTRSSRHGEGESILVAVAGTIPYRKASLDPTDSWCLSSLYESSYAIEADQRSTLPFAPIE